MQTYKPYRTTLLDKETLHRLRQVRPAQALRDIAIEWLMILGAFTAVALYPAWGVICAAIVVIGTRYYALLIIAHDGLHRRVHPVTAKNDLIVDIGILGAIGCITRLNRLNHMRHHLVTCEASDPDRHKYTHDRKGGTIRFLGFLSGLLNIATALRNIFQPQPIRRDGAESAGDVSGVSGLETKRNPGQDGYRLRDVPILLGWQIALIGGSTVAIGWWAYPVLWLLPVYAFGYRADLTRVFCEHSAFVDDRSADMSMRLFSFRSNWLERQFFAPHNMNHHMAHHLWPDIPYYNLPEAERLMRQSPAADEGLVWRSSYLRHLFDYWRSVARPRRFDQQDQSNAV